MCQMRIEIYSDVVCPWCYIGKRRLDAALETDALADVEVVWRPHQLHPNLPPAGLDREDYLQRRYGEAAERARAPQRIVAEGADAGIRFNFEAMRRMPNTLAAHRLLHFAEDTGRQHALAEALFRFFFCDGRDVAPPIPSAKPPTRPAWTPKPPPHGSPPTAAPPPSKNSYARGSSAAWPACRATS